MVSFSTKTKNELSRLEIKNRELARAELAGIIQISGYVSLNGLKDLQIEIGTENGAISRRTYNLLKKAYGIQPEVEVRKSRNLKKTNKYVNKISNDKDVRRILLDISVLEKSNNSIFNMKNNISEEFSKNFDLKRAYLRGTFLGGGSLSNPEKMYHLEFITNDKLFREKLVALLNSFNLNSKTIERKEYHIIYIKEGEKIVDFLNIIEAHNALLELENIRIIKEMRNNINRIVNCETANIAKTTNASLRQIQKIKKIERTIGLQSLPENLRETAEIRLKNENLTLTELGNLHNPKVGKSGVNHRLRKIEKIADRLE